METIVYCIAITLALIAAFILGMYVCTQIERWIDKNIKK